MTVDMKIYFSRKKTGIGLLLALLFIRLAFWQWDRHQEKLLWIESLNARLDMPTADIKNLAMDPETDWSKVPYRKTLISGSYLFDSEMRLRNRKHNSSPGVFILTPLKIDGVEKCILVSRGFIPIQFAMDKERVRTLQKDRSAKFIGLLKEPSSSASFLAPKDPDPKPGEFAAEWLRVDIQKMQRQIPCELLPVYAEIMSTTDREEIKAKIIVSNDERSELLNLASRGVLPATSGFNKDEEYPIPVFDLVIPPARHLGYVFEWSFIALLTLGITLLIQLKPPRK